MKPQTSMMYKRGGSGKVGSGSDSDAWVRYALIAVLALLAGFALYYMVSMRKSSAEMFSDGTYHLVYVYNENCPHCKNFAPEFARFKQMVATTASLKISEFEYHQKEASVYVNMPQVVGFPCLLLFGPDGNFIKEQVGARPAEGVLEFVKAHAGAPLAAAAAS